MRLELDEGVSKYCIKPTSFFLSLFDIPPPPPTAAPEVIVIVEDIDNIEETVIESTETSQDDEIAERELFVEDLNVEGEKLTFKNYFTSFQMHEMYHHLSSFQEVFKKTGGSHAAAIFDKNRKIISIKEDIGRHNAVDKTVGDLLLKKQLNFVLFHDR